MITVFSGTLGGGKSYDAVHTAIKYLREGSNVIADFPIDIEGLKGIRGQFFLLHDITIPVLVRYAECRHDLSSFNEQQTVVIIDEVYNYFDPREYGREDRMLWISFLKMSRHFCFSFILICQDAKTDIDKKVLRCIEYDVTHIDVRRLQWGFQLLCLFTGRWFLCIKWRCSKGVPRTKIDAHFVHLNKNFARRYNSHHLFKNSTFGRQLADYQRKQAQKGIEV